MKQFQGMRLDCYITKQTCVALQRQQQQNKRTNSPTGEDASDELQCSKVSTRVARNTGIIKPKNISVNRVDTLHVSSGTNKITSLKKMLQLGYYSLSQVSTWSPLKQQQNKIKNFNFDDASTILLFPTLAARATRRKDRHQGNEA